MFPMRMIPVLAVATLLPLAACADRSGPLAPDDPMRATTGQPAADASGATAALSLPNARYAMTLVAEDIPSFVPPELVPLLIGDWELDFTAPRHSVGRIDGEIVVESRYTATPTRLVTRDVSGPLACMGPGIEQGVYGWSLENGELTFTVIQDRCDGRAFVLTAKPWTMQ